MTDEAPRLGAARDVPLFFGTIALIVSPRNP